METDEITRTTALERLDPLLGTWSIEAHFAGVPPSGVGGETTFERALDGAFVVERSEVEHPDAPNGLAIVAFDPDTGAYRQHYFDSRGVIRLYAMELRDASGRCCETRRTSRHSSSRSASPARSTTTAAGSTAVGRSRTTTPHGSSTSS